MGLRSIPIMRSWLAVLALGVAAFTVYGSLVPFKFQQRDFSNAVEAYQWVWQNRVHIQSRSDALANFLLGVPLGFGLLGALRLDKPEGLRTVLMGLAIIPLCFLFAAAVEFSQLWVPSRTCAASDVLAQTLGATMGVAIWLGFGEALVRFARNMWDSPKIGGRFGRALIVYGVFLVAVETLPWDFTASPSDWFKKRHYVTWMPFEEISDPLKYRVVPMDKARVWVELIALFLPVGLIGAGLPGVWSRASGLPWICVAAIGLATVMELAQWPVVSRHPSVTDILIDAGSVVIGWLVGRAIYSGRMPVVVPVVGWLVLLAVYHWWPVEFDPSVVQERLQEIEWRPFMSLESKQPMMWLEEVAVKMLIAAPIGAAAVRGGPTRVLFLSLMVGLLFECGQLAMARHYPSLTDVLLAGMGGLFGFGMAKALTRESSIDQEVTA